MHPENSIYSYSEVAHQLVAEFYENNKNEAEFIDDCLNISWAITCQILENKKNDPSFLWPSQMFQTLHEYFRNSILLVMSKNLDEGIAILRMAAELARDIKCIFRDNSLIDIWLERRNNTGTSKKQYSKKFRFDENTKEGFAALGIYNLACKYGIHGHLTKSMASTLKSKKLNDDFVIFTVTNDYVLKYTQIWIMAFISLYSYVLDWEKLSDSHTLKSLERDFLVLIVASDKFTKSSYRL